MIKKLENTSEVTTNIINTINTIFSNLFSSVDNSLYEVLDAYNSATDFILYISNWYKMEVEG